MESLTIPYPNPSQAGAGSRRAGWALSGLATLFLALDGAMKLAQLPIVAETSAQLGWPSDPGTIYLLAALLLGSTLLYAIPRTAVLGAIRGSGPMTGGGRDGLDFVVRLGARREQW